ncbi:MAG: hypothetical protein M1412_00660 [Deltaproteobacteria bacterium]|nr:hypothetical protein [Deltaproteobacteria bacterium]MCL5891664.1 hypothetical protein [Deltaproteobacteria bacterium]
MLMETEKSYKLKDLPLNKVFFWSYDKEKADLPLSLIMEPVIKKGNLEDLYLLFNTFPLEELKKAYFNEIRPVLSGENKEYYRLRPSVKPNKQSVWLMDILFKAAKEMELEERHHDVA